MRWWLVWLWLAAMPLANAAGSAYPGDLVAWLNQVAVAAERLNYTGTFVYQHGSSVEVSKVSHRVDSGGEMAKIDVLSGPPHAFVSVNDQVFCYIPDGDHVKVEKRERHKFFPALLPVPASAIAEYYTLKPLGHASIAGHDCVGVMLVPKDEYRYGYVLWADAATGLLLKAQPLNANNKPSGQFVFTQVSIGTAPQREAFESAFADKKNVRVASEDTYGLTDWRVKKLPAGFAKVMEARRMLPGKKTPVVQLVYSDGLATVSLFIEPYANLANPMRGLSSQSLLNVYARPVGAYQVTALGEVPSDTVIQMADSLAQEGERK
ncbi:MAG TPA: MucB/RseB C-terminal domain-containing protein [Sulfuriferula sp.]|nr:MucB/RseB C-terminal domain-containing protein [Sulfuriferula sp.]